MFKTFKEVIYKSNTIISCKLVQIVFWLLDKVNLIYRFCSDYLIKVDAIFRINNKRMPLIISIGLTNKNKQFAIAFSYYLGETIVSYSNFFSILNSKIFTNSIPSLKVTLTNNSTSIYLVVTNSTLSTSIIY